MWSVEDKEAGEEAMLVNLFIVFTRHLIKLVAVSYYCQTIENRLASHHEIQHKIHLNYDNGSGFMCFFIDWIF